MKTQVGHAQTFAIAVTRAYVYGGLLELRIEDLDYGRCKPHLLIEMIEDLLWFGIKWNGGPSPAMNLIDILK